MNDALSLMPIYLGDYGGDNIVRGGNEDQVGYVSYFLVSGYW